MGKYIDKILDSTIGSTIGFIALDFIVMALCIQILKMVLGLFLPATAELPNSIATIIIAIVFLLIYMRYMRGRLQNLLSTKNFILALILIIPSLIIIIGNFITNYFEGQFVFNYLVIISGLAPGISEEIVFRGFIVSNLMRIRKNKNLSIYWIVVLSAVPFGLLHLANIIMGANIPFSIVQSFFAICTGVLFAAVYLRTGNLIVPMIAHAVIDIVGLANAQYIGSKVVGLIAQTPSLYDYLFIIISSIIILICALYYIRKAKWDNIDNVWEDIIK